MTRRTTSSGFTLIELSIVLVIIGLIVGGVLVGQDLIRAAELRSVISDIEKFNTAVNTFRTKYDCLPGDCPNATQFFGTDLQCANNAPLTTGTCNGDGDGIISASAGTGTGNNFYHMESLMFWQQLALAGLIPGQYSGLGANGNDGFNPDNSPVSRFSNNSCYFIAYTGPTSPLGLSTTGYMFTDAAFHAFFFGNSSGGHGGSWCGNTGGPLTALEDMNIDQKTDDGLPASGQIQTMSWAIINGVAAPDPCVTFSPPVYNTSYSPPVCMLLFQTQF